MPPIDRPPTRARRFRAETKEIMTYETLRRRFSPETGIEHEAVQRLTEMCGSWPECASCKREVSSCQLLEDEYEAIIERLSYD